MILMAGMPHLHEVPMEITFKPLLLAAAMTLCVPSVQAASTLVYCSEASPAGFDPSQ
jgi:peptide/nickel transport system substrate-binding protein/dipeptide transport system substrate-binding protein